MKPETSKAKQEETLDPEDWEATRKLGHKMIDDMVDYLEDCSRTPSLAKYSSGSQIPVYLASAN